MQTYGRCVDLVDRMARECFGSFSVIPGARLLDQSALSGVTTDVRLSFFNGVGATKQRPTVERDVTVAAEELRRQQRPFRWWVTPECRDWGLPQLLEREGLKHAFDAPGMVMDLRADVRPAPPLASDLRIIVVRTEFDMQKWASVLASVFERPASERGEWVRAFGHCGFGVEGAWTHFVASIDATPVATASVLIAGALAGVYHVGTLPELRGRGIGRAITAAALAHARGRGATDAVLQSSELGESVYRSLGFVFCCPLTMYSWIPEEPGEI